MVFTEFQQFFINLLIVRVAAQMAIQVDGMLSEIPTYMTDSETYVQAAVESLYP